MKQMLVALIMCVVGSVSALGEIVTTFWEGPMLFQVLSEEDGTAALIAPTVESMNAEYLQGMTKITVPSTVTDSSTGLCYQVVTIRGDVFSPLRVSVEEVVIPDGVKEVYGFNKMPNLKSVILPNSVEKMGIFCGLTALKRLDFPENLKEITMMSFAPNSLERIVLPAGVKRLEYYTFTGGLETTEIEIPGVEVIGEHALGGMPELKKIVFPACLRWIDWEAVRYNNLEEIRFESDGTDAECSLYYNCLTSRPKAVYCARPVPPVINHYDLFVSDGGENREKICYSLIFGGFAHMQNIKLYVPVGYGEVYRQHRFWGAMQVQEYDFDAGVTVSVADVKNDVTSFYDLLGRNVAQVDSAPPGIYVRAGRKHLVR